MIRVKVSNIKSGKEICFMDLTTPQEATDWINQFKYSFGKSDRELQAKKDIDGNWYFDNENILEAISFRDGIDSFGNPTRFYSFKADYDVVQEDVTAEYNAIAAKKLSIENAKTGLASTKPAMTLPELSDAVNKILLIMGIK